MHIYTYVTYILSAKISLLVRVCHKICSFRMGVLHPPRKLHANQLCLLSVWDAAACSELQRVTPSSLNQLELRRNGQKTTTSCLLH